MDQILFAYVIVYSSHFEQLILEDFVEIEFMFAYV